MADLNDDHGVVQASPTKGDVAMNWSAGHIEIFVTDPIRSRHFYEEILGCTVEDVQGEEFVWLNLGKLTLLLRPGKGSAQREEYREAESGIVLYTNDLDAARKELQSRGLTFRGTDGSDICLTFTDPDGHWFQLVDPGDH